MMPLHPPSSGAPLAFVISLVVVELRVLFPRFKSSCATIRMFLVCACLISVMLAFISGYQASSLSGSLPEVTEQVLAKHHAIGRFLLINSGMLATFFTLSRYASNGARVLMVLYYLVLCIQVALTCIVGDLGGDLVFDYGVGVQR